MRLVSHVVSVGRGTMACSSILSTMGDPNDGMCISNLIPFTRGFRHLRMCSAGQFWHGFPDLGQEKSEGLEVFCTFMVSCPHL